MFTKRIGVATLFTAGALMVGGAPSLSATPVEAFTTGAAFAANGGCGAQDAGKTPDQPKAAKAKDGSCGKGSCGSKDVKKAKKAKKDASCGKDKKAAKDGSCGKDKK